jgi:cytoskeletal protein RodZ
MKSIIVRSAIILGLGIAPGAVLAQSEQILKPQVQPQTEGQTGATTEQPAEGQAGTTELKPPEGQAEAPAEEPAEGQAEAPAEEPTEGQAEAPADSQDETQTGAISPVEVTVEQKTEIKQVVQEVDVEPVAVDRIDFDIDVGVAVPRTIVVHPLPPRIVEIVPEYEGYLYFLLADGRIVIVEPDTLKIVVIIV